MDNKLKIREVCGEYALDILFEDMSVSTIYFHSQKNAEAVKRIISDDGNHTIFDTPENAPKLWNRRTYCYQAERAVQDMTAEKAIEVLNEIGEGANIEDMLKNLSNSNTFTALKLAVHALEKQVAKKLKEVTRTSSNKKSRVKAFEHNYNHQNWQDPVPIPEYKECQWTDYQCPICNALIKEGRPECCWRCGQAFDWSDEMEGEK
nr:MAG TPA: ribosome, girodazole, girolline, antibiotic complex, 50S [Caudoviricetes sp.]